MSDWARRLPAALEPGQPAAEARQFRPIRFPQGVLRRPVLLQPGEFLRLPAFPRQQVRLPAARCCL